MREKLADIDIVVRATSDHPHLRLAPESIDQILSRISGEIEKGLLMDDEIAKILPEFPLYLPSRQSGIRQVIIAQLDKILSLLKE